MYARSESASSASSAVCPASAGGSVSLVLVVSVGQRASVLDAAPAITVPAPAPLGDPFGEFVCRALAVGHRPDRVDELLVVSALSFGDRRAGGRHRHLVQTVVVVRFVVCEPRLDCLLWPVLRRVGSPGLYLFDSGRVVVRVQPGEPPVAHSRVCTPDAKK